MHSRRLFGDTTACWTALIPDLGPLSTRCGHTDQMRSSAKGGALRMIVDCPSAYVVDGDTLRCGAERLRLLGIDAPEIGRCSRWRVCAQGDGQAAKRSLVAALRLGPVRYQPVTVDRYGRQVVVAWAGSVNLSCWQLQRRQAIYKPKWDN